MIVISEIIFGSDSKSKGNKSKHKQMSYIKLKSFCTAREAINKMKKQLVEWEKIFANHVSDKRIIFKTYELIQLNSKNKTI